jgi:hypothetical protein
VTNSTPADEGGNGIARVASTIRLAAIGAGKIARQEHLPAIGLNGDYEFVGIVDPVACPADVQCLPGGLGAFDPGINALSIISAVMHDPIWLTAARLEVPKNCFTPRAAQLKGRFGRSGDFEASFDFLQTGPPTWTIDVYAGDQCLRLSEGGARISVDGQDQPVLHAQEYPSLYRRFAELIAKRMSEVDMAPLAIVADAFLIGGRVTVAEFVE